MKYHNITKDDMKNGMGLRVVLWVSGCTHRCKNCQNPITWNPDVGLEFDESAKQEIYDQLNKDYISGITLSGGDPFFIGNREEILSLIKDIKEKYPHKTIWSYTGYEWEDIKDLEHMKYIDVMLVGKFVNDLKDNNIHWVGSSNQRVIDVKKSLETNSVVLYEKQFND